MKYKNAIITLGVLIAVILSSFVGIPRSWKESIATVLALLVSVLAYVGSRSKTRSVTPTDVSLDSTSSNSQ